MFKLYVYIDYGYGELKVNVGNSKVKLTSDEIVQKAIILGILDSQFIKYVTKTENIVIY